MGEQDYFSEYLEWLKEIKTDLNEFLVLRGVEGILDSFETWLIQEGHLKERK